MILKHINTLREDSLLQRILRNSGYLFGSNAVSAVLAFVQGILAVRLLGVADWGLVAVITTFATNINRFLTFRMSEVVVKRMSQALADGKKEGAAAAVKAAGLVESVMSVLAFIVVLVLAKWGATKFGHDPQAASWFAFYGVVLLGNLVYETSTGVLQATRLFNRQAQVNLIQSIITLSIVVSAFLIDLKVGGLPRFALIYYVLLAYMLGKVYAGLSMAVLASFELKATLGTGWWRIPLKDLPDKWAMASFAINTNLNGTVNLFVRDNIPIYMSWLLGTIEVGYLKLAMTLISPISLILDPFIWPTYVEIMDSVSNQLWADTRRLLKRVSFIAGSVVGALGGGLVLFGWWLIPTLYSVEAAPAYPALLILLVGYGFASIFQWNRPLLLSLGKPGFPVLISAAVGVLELGLIFWLVPQYGYLMMAGLLSAFFVVSITIITWHGLHTIKMQEGESA